MTSIKEIAKIAGVSVSTVSRVINGSKLVKESKRKKVLNAIQNSDYKPNAFARRLKRKDYQTMTIGIALPIVVHPFYFEILKGAYNALTQKGYNLIIYNLDINRNQILDMIVNDNLSGVLIVSLPLSEEEKNYLSMNKIKYIYLNYHDETDNYIFVNNVSGGKLVASFLIEKGAKKIGYVGENLKSPHQTERFNSFKNELEKHGLSIQLERYVNLNEQESYELTKDIIKNTDIDGIFYYCDELAYGGLKAKNELNNKLLLIGFDDLPSSKYMGLTTVRQPAYFMGYEGALQILNLLSTSVNPGHPIIQKCLEPELIKRN